MALDPWPWSQQRLKDDYLISSNCDSEVRWLTLRDSSVKPRCPIFSVTYHKAYKTALLSIRHKKAYRHHSSVHTTFFRCHMTARVPYELLLAHDGVKFRPHSCLGSIKKDFFWLFSRMLLQKLLFFISQVYLYGVRIKLA